MGGSGGGGGGLVSSTIPSLISGVSQQPWNVRLVTQAEEQVNCYSSVVDFMKRRPATRHIAKLFNQPECPPSDTLAVHHINRDQQEQYIVVAGHKKLSVFDMNGQTRPVNISDSGMQYLDCSGNTDNASLKFLTINDYTFILNTQKTIAMSAEVTPGQPNEAFVFIKQASYNTTYTVYLNNVPFSFTTQDGVAPADQPADSLSSSEITSMLASKIISQTVSDIRYSGTMRGTFDGTLQGSFLIPGHYQTEDDKSIWVPDKWVYRVEQGTFYAEGTGSFTGTMSGGVMTGNFPGLVFTSGKYAVNCRDYTFSGTFQGETSPPLQVGYPGDSYSVDFAHSTLWIRRKDGADFSIRAEDSRSNTHITSYKGKVQNFSELPRYALNNSVVEVTGDAGNAFDSYYVKFITDSADGGLGKGVWKETVKPGCHYRLDWATMPHALVRQADGTFTFAAVPWGERTCGDEDSSPEPSFVGRSISGMLFYRNRLCFLSWENVIMSQAGEFFSFFPTTVTTLVDNDPVDVAASHTRPTALEHAAVFSGGLLLFTADMQFTLEHDTVLSNTTASIKPVSEFAASMKTEPVSSGKTVFFVVDRGEYTGIREYLTLPDNTDQNDAADVTAHVPRYIGGNAHKLICSTNEDVLLVLSRKDRNQIFVYKYFWNGAEKVQSSWSRWVMPGEVVSGFIRETELFLLMKYPDGIYLEKMSFEPGFKDENTYFEYRMDRKISDKDLFVSYDPDTRLSTINLPYPVTPQTLPECVSAGGKGTQAGWIFPSVSLGADGTTLIVKGDVRNAHFFIGIPFESSYTFSPFALRDQNNGGSAVMSGRLQLRSIALSWANTGFLNVEVTPQFRASSVYSFTARQLGHGYNIIGQCSLYTGQSKIPILSRNTQVSVRVYSSSFFPFALVNATWEGFYNTRNQRV